MVYIPGMAWSVYYEWHGLYTWSYTSLHTIFTAHIQVVCVTRTKLLCTLRRYKVSIVAVVPHVYQQLDSIYTSSSIPAAGQSVYQQLYTSSWTVCIPVALYQYTSNSKPVAILSIYQSLYSPYTSRCTVHVPASVQSVYQSLYSPYTSRCTVHVPASVQSMYQPLYSPYTSRCTVRIPIAVQSIYQRQISVYASRVAWVNISLLRSISTYRIVLSQRKKGRPPN